MKNLLRILALLICIGIFVVSGKQLAEYLLRSRREQAENESIAVRVHEIEAKNEEGSAPPKYAASGILSQYDELWQKNHDMAGWLRIEGTAIDYPVMYTPDEPEHYLHLSFSGEWAASGCLFIGEGWSEAAGHTIIYGHHMKDGSMLTGLEEYAASDFAAAHPVIQYDTLTEEGRYEILAAFYSRVYSTEEEGGFRYYQYTDLSDPERFAEYLRQVKASALYDTGLTAAYGDPLLTLSTCSYHTDGGRFVVVAKKH